MFYQGKNIKNDLENFYSLKEKPMTFLQEQLRQSEFDKKKEEILNVAKQINERLRSSKIIQGKISEEVSDLTDLLR